MSQHSAREFSSIAALGVVRGLSSESLKTSNAYVHPSFREAESRGAEPAVLRQMGERMAAEFIFNCKRHNVDPSRLSKDEIVEGMDATLRGMVKSERAQFATTSFKGFREFYNQSRDEFKLGGARAAERHTQSLIETLRAANSSTMLKPAERAVLEGRIVKEASVAGSAYRAAGMTPRHVVAMFKDNTDVAKSPVVALIERTIDEDVKFSMARRADAAKSLVVAKSAAPRPGWAGDLDRR